jgi:phage tail sheath protein FI
MFALDYADLFNILCIPRAAQLTSDSDTIAVVSAALKYCDDRRAFMIIDLPNDTDQVQEAKDWLDAHGSFRNNNAALYFPHPRIPDPVNEYRLRTVGASGTMAGIYARTDSARGVWKAPAGIEATLSGVADLDTKLTDAQNGSLNPLGINCLRSFPIYGGIAWGARTLQGADQIGSEWKYIPIRRLALMLEESLFRGTKWVVFEPNDEPLWANIRLNVGAYMMSLFRQGAFQGTNPKDAFFVKCDGETTTEDDRNKGIVNILVGFAPLKPAEFVVISIQQIAGQL